jgi:hypothetical protein
MSLLIGGCRASSRRNREHEESMAKRYSTYVRICLGEAVGIKKINLGINHKTNSKFTSIEEENSRYNSQIWAITMLKLSCVKQVVW